MVLNTKILSSGMYVPNQVVTNFDLEKIMETNDEWIQQRSGIKERRWVEPGIDTTLSMATVASKQALDRAHLNVDEIDMIIFGALVTDYVFPGTGVLLQESLGFSKTVPALDIRNQCSGFIYALSVADAWIRSGMYKKILIVGSEIHSTSIDKTTRGRDISVLFGDGAGAMIVEACADEKSKILSTVLHSEGKGSSVLCLKKPSSNDSPRIQISGDFDLELYPQMEGRLVFKNAVTRMSEAILEVCSNTNTSPDDIDFVIAHQANLRINQMVLDNLKIPHSKTHNTLQKYGNTTMATIPITFDEAVLEGKIQRGDLVALVAFGAGFTWGATLLRY
ncbi:MAG: ketoacyl-ACP synthase III [Bdellovibrionaceae bacterium]|nr:ketoacyl-ACP synthase III [Pseudobdellovibrionaceae bacterium]